MRGICPSRRANIFTIPRTPRRTLSFQLELPLEQWICLLLQDALHDPGDLLLLETTGALKDFKRAYANLRPAPGNEVGN